MKTGGCLDSKTLGSVLRWLLLLAVRLELSRKLDGDIVKTLCVYTERSATTASGRATCTRRSSRS